MKAILIMGMPDRCGECPLCILNVSHCGKDDRFYCGRTAKNVDKDKKSENCPLRPFQLGEELRKFRYTIKDIDTLIGFNMAVAICNKYLGEEE